MHHAYSYSLPLVALSVAVAMLASYAALELASHVPGRRETVWPWIVGGSFAMGLGIWAMHFIGMLAMRAPFELRYSLGATLASMLLPVASSAMALWIASRGIRSWPTLITAGSAVGLGICAMHYVGMRAIQITPPISYDPWLVFASLLIAIAASTLALWIAFRVRSGRAASSLVKPGAAVVLGFAIVGMHYTGMAAASFDPAAAPLPAGALLDSAAIAVTVAVVTSLILVAALIIVILNAHMRRQSASLESAQASMRARDDFLAMLSHELRNPIAAMSTAATLLSDEFRDERTLPLARDTILRQSANLKRMLDDLLDVSRVLRGKVSLSPEPLDLHAVAARVLQTLQGTGALADRRVTLEGGPAWVKADATRLEQVLVNLITNAAAHTRRDDLIRVAVECKGDEATASVIDTGRGIAAEDLSKIFDPFFQGAQPMHATRGSLGIGLSLVRGIVELHGGRVVAESEGPGRGARFTVSLPAMEAPGTVAAFAATSVAPFVRLRIALVEDNADAREMLRVLLEGLGHEVLTAEDGEQGVQLLAKGRFDVAFIDIGLPKVTGYEVASRSAGGGTFLVAITGYGQAEDRARSRKAGFDEHLTKPVGWPELEQVLNAAAVRAAA